MTERRRAALVFFLLALLAAAFRFPRLADRPMHVDEAVNADKVDVLLEQGRYEYSIVDYHGPTLIYAGLAAMKLQGIHRYGDMTEVSLRLVPAVAGVLLVAAHYFLAPYVGWMAAAFAGLLTAVSPAMVYYSRYFIHETLFVFLTFCALLAVLAYGKQRNAARAAVVGLLFGLMFATKETVILPALCMVLANVPVWRRKSFPPAGHIVIAVAVAIAIGLIFLSSFGGHPRGIIDSVLAYRTYFARGTGHNTFHVHPWYYYFQLLLYFRVAGGPVWSEAFIAILAIAGALVGYRLPGVARFLGLYTLLMMVLYSAIAHKAPWNLLGFPHGMILLGGIGAAWLIARVTPRIAMLVVLLTGCGLLGSQARAASFQYASDPRNPWVYAHTGTDVFPLVKEIEALAAVDPAGRAMPIQIYTRQNLWPLPWYLRRFPQVRWWNGISPSAPNAPVILATPDLEPDLIHKLYDLPPPGHREMYVNMFDHYVELRPSVEIRGYIAKSLWDNLQEAR